MKDNEAMLGVGDGTGNHFVTGSYETIKLLQNKLLELERLQRIVNSCPIVIETPNDVCDGVRIDTYNKLHDDYGDEIEKWIVSQKDYKDCERVLANRSMFLRQIK